MNLETQKKSKNALMVEQIHKLFLSGKKKEAVKLIREYNLTFFFRDYQTFLDGLKIHNKYEIFSGLTVYFHEWRFRV